MYAVDNEFVLGTPAGFLAFKRPPQTDFTDWGGMIGPGGVTTSVDLRESRTPIARTDGEVIGNSFWGNRSIVLDVFVPIANPELRGQTLERIHRRLASMVNSDGVLYWIEKDGSNWASDLSQGQANIGTDTVLTEGTPRRVPVRLQSMPTISHETGPAKTVQIVLNAKQPFVESDFDPAIHTGTTFQGTTSIFELTSEALAGSVTAYNYGSATVWPVLTVTGPFTGLKISAGSSFLTYSNAASTANLTIDTRPNIRTIIGTIGTSNFNAYDKVTVANWGAFSIPPGIEDADDDNLYTGGTKQFTLSEVAGGSSSTTKLKVAWRWAWL